MKTYDIKIQGFTEEFIMNFIKMDLDAVSKYDLEGETRKDYKERTMSDKFLTEMSEILYFNSEQCFADPDDFTFNDSYFDVIEDMQTQYDKL